MTVRFVFYDGEGQITNSQFAQWLVLVIAAFVAVEAVSTGAFALLRERFARSAKQHVLSVRPDSQWQLDPLTASLSSGSFAKT